MYYVTMYNFKGGLRKEGERGGIEDDSESEGVCVCII